MMVAASAIVASRTGAPTSQIVDAHLVQKTLDQPGERICAGDADCRTDPGERGAVGNDEPHHIGARAPSARRTPISRVR